MKQTEHSGSNKTNAMANNLSVKKESQAAFSKLSQMAHESPQVSQLRAYQKMANSGKPVQAKAMSSVPVVTASPVGLQEMKKISAENDGYHVFGDPAPTNLTALTAASGDPETLGFTSPPSGYEPPRFNYNTEQDAQGKWTASPTQLNAPDKGILKHVLYVQEGTHNTGMPHANGKKIRKEVSAAMANLSRDAEAEHVSDFEEAYEVSFLQIHNALRAEVYGHEFGPEDDKAAAIKLVDDEILEHISDDKKFGVDPDVWDYAYMQLYKQSEKRDDNGWHTFDAEDAAVQNDAEWHTMVVTAGDSDIGTHASEDVISCDDLEDADDGGSDDEADAPVIHVDGGGDGEDGDPGSDNDQK